MVHLLLHSATKKRATDNSCRTGTIPFSFRNEMKISRCIVLSFFTSFLRIVILGLILFYLPNKFPVDACCFFFSMHHYSAFNFSAISLFLNIWTWHFQRCIINSHSNFVRIFVRVVWLASPFFFSLTYYKLFIATTKIITIHKQHTNVGMYMKQFYLREAIFCCNVFIFVCVHMSSPKNYIYIFAKVLFHLMKICNITTNAFSQFNRRKL